MADAFDIRTFRTLPKSDLHNHCLLGGKRAVIERHYGKRLSKFKAATRGIGDLNEWVVKEFRPFFSLPGSFEKGVEAAFIQAKSDGVTRLEMSIDVMFGAMFNVPASRIVATLKDYHQMVAPEIDFLPELGFSRSKPMRMLLPHFDQYLDFNYFKSIDLYDDENAQPVANFRELYRYAKKQGLKCKAHAGEFGSAESVREAVEILDLDAVQHGNGAAESPVVMRWLADNKIQLNVCPTSNIKLKRVRSYKTHPIRILFDHGIKVTINTDDALIFGDGVSEQFYKLSKAEVFSAEELEIIRQNGLNSGDVLSRSI